MFEVPPPELGGFKSVRVRSAGNSYPDTQFDVDASWLAVCQNVDITDPLQIGQAMEIDVNLKQPPVGNVAGNLNELQDLGRLVQLEAPLVIVDLTPGAAIIGLFLGLAQRSHTSTRRFCSRPS